MDISIEKTTKQYRKILWVGKSSEKLISILEQRPESYKHLRNRLSNGYDIKKDIEYDENISMPIWDSKSKSIVDFSETPDYLEQQKENEKLQLIQNEKNNILESQAIENLKADGKLDENGEIKEV